MLVSHQMRKCGTCRDFFASFGFDITPLSSRPLGLMISPQDHYSIIFERQHGQFGRNI